MQRRHGHTTSRNKNNYDMIPPNTPVFILVFPRPYFRKRKLLNKNHYSRHSILKSNKTQIEKSYQQIPTNFISDLHHRQEIFYVKTTFLTFPINTPVRMIRQLHRAVQASKLVLSNDAPSVESKGIYIDTSRTDTDTRQQSPRGVSAWHVFVSLRLVSI